MNELLKTLSKDLCQLLDVADEYNVLITVGTDDNTKTFKAHTVILRSRSAYFRYALSGDWARKDHIVFNKPNISPEAFEVILKYIYGATINLSAIGMLTLLEILIASDEFCLAELTSFITNHLFARHKQWMRENFILVHKIAFLHEAFKKLQEFCLKTIQIQPDVVFKANDFAKIDINLLTSLLERSNLFMPEIEIWDALIKWGMFNTSPPLEPDYETWPGESFENLQETLHRFIPLINFTTISSSDFYHKILPFQRVLPTELFDDLLKFHLAPHVNPSHPILRSPKRNQQIQSIFINHIHAAWIMSQIDKDINKSIVSRVLNPSKAIRNTHGPSFGDGDLWVKVTAHFTNNATLPSFCRQKSYDKKIADFEQFYVEDFEVFQIIKKSTVIYL
ncbi:19892_t:CDS:2 [Cetraspora pellucida]|uniref:19892_t:CDS:1 n=2 Tax=Cetraspora pellucida TaxID=1433469 RepID=A0A9N9BRB1_9GLOM|nr:19892_t:CDS:2 [Cetraspora pellucida]